MNTSGLDLKLERVSKRVRATQIAAVMGVHRSRISNIEREQFITPTMAQRYRDALRTCVLNGTSEIPA